METQGKKLTNDEKENVLLVLNEFSENHKENTKAVNNLLTVIKEYTGKTTMLLEKTNNTSGLSVSEINEVTAIIDAGLDKVNTAIQQIAFPKNEMKILEDKLDKNILLLQNPLPQKTVHHHYVSKVTWIAIGLFLALILVCTAWYMTADKLDGYIANDTKYRHLKLDTGNVIVQKHLYKTDSLFRANPALRDSVIETEEEYRRNFELLQKATHMKTEAETLKQEAKKLEEKASKK